MSSKYYVCVSFITSSISSKCLKVFLDLPDRLLLSLIFCNTSSAVLFSLWFAGTSTWILLQLPNVLQFSRKLAFFVSNCPVVAVFFHLPIYLLIMKPRQRPKLILETYFRYSFCQYNLKFWTTFNGLEVAIKWRESLWHRRCFQKFFRLKVSKSFRLIRSLDFWIQNANVFGRLKDNSS